MRAEDCPYVEYLNGWDSSVCLSCEAQGNSSRKEILRGQTSREQTAGERTPRAQRPEAKKPRGYWPGGFI